MREAVLWGHQLDDYRRMFGLSDADFLLKILEFNCGVTAVNAALYADQHLITSCDPWFNLDKNLLVETVHLSFEAAIGEVNSSRAQYDFSDYGSFEALVERRREGMALALSDYERGRRDKRYLSAPEVGLPFEDFLFDLALSSHFLFADNSEEGVEFHLKIIKELARVSKEVRIFPLVGRDGQPSHLLGPVLLGLQQQNYGVEVRNVDDHLQVGGHAMLRVWALACQV